MYKEYILEYFTEFKKILDSISIDKLSKMIDLILEAYNNERRIFIFGNGGSALCASHFSCDINKGVSFGLEKRFKVICLNDNVATMLAYANDISYADIFTEQLKNFLKPNDLVIGISASGNSENVLRAIDYGNEKKAKTIGLTGFDGGKLAKISQFALIVGADDMQKVEDAHLIISHIIMQILYNHLHKGKL